LKEIFILPKLFKKIVYVEDDMFGKISSY